MRPREGEQRKAKGSETPDLAHLRREIVKAAAITDQTERLLEVAAIIGEAFSDLDVEPVVVGGLAVGYWSGEPIITGDIDLVMLRVPQLSQRLEALGLKKDGRLWVLPDHDVAVEAPAERLEPGDRARRVELPSGRPLLVLSVEDMVLWRLRQWIYWRSTSGFDQASHLIVSRSIDPERLRTRAAAEGLGRALATLQEMSSNIQEGRAYESWEIGEAASELSREIGGR